MASLRLRITIETQLLERGDELDALLGALADAREGQGRVVFVEGEAGIGKTSLLVEVRAAAQAAGCTVNSAAGGDLEREFAWGVVRQLFEPLIVNATAAQRRTLLAGAAELAQTVLGVSADAHAAPHGDAAFAAQHGLFWVVANLCERGPVVIIVDDAHWADPASLRFLNYAGRRLAELPVLLVVGARTAEPGAPNDLLHALRRDAVLVRPSSLSVNSVAETSPAGPSTLPARGSSPRAMKRPAAIRSCWRSCCVTSAPAPPRTMTKRRRGCALAGRAQSLRRS